MSLRVINQPCVFPLRRGYQVGKRVMDLALCLLFFPLCVPLMAVVGLLIVLESPGPVIFVQRRTGKGGKRFRMYKFRTMIPNAEELKAVYAHMNELTQPDFKITNDPRVTQVGRFLRKTSLDELPQLLNILRGEMSWVGPRPTSFSADTYQLWHTERLEVMPGLTGLWQVTGRSNLDFDERVKLDIEYIERQSFWFDLEILARTVLAVLSAEGAH